MANRSFYEPFKSGDERYEPKELTFKEKVKMMKEGIKLLPHEFELLKQEAKAKFYDDPPLALPGKYIFFTSLYVLNKLKTSDSCAAIIVN